MSQDKLWIRTRSTIQSYPALVIFIVLNQVTNDETNIGS